MQTLVETDTLGGERGAHHLARPIDTIQVPATVEAVLAARIDRLPPEARRLLQAASVVGKDVPFALLQAIADVPEDALRRGLATLQAAEFMYEAGIFPDHEYTFKHALTHDVAYGSLLEDRRRRSTARSWRPSSGSIPTGWPSTSNGWPTMPSGPRRGKRPSPTSGRPAPRPSRARPTATRSRTSSRR